MRRVAQLLLLTCLTASLIAATPEEKAEAAATMLESFDDVLTGMAAVAAGLCFFAIVWAGFLLMAEGAEGEGRGRARNAVLMAVVGLVLVLLAKTITLLLTSGIIPSL